MQSHLPCQDNFELVHLKFLNILLYTLLLHQFFPAVLVLLLLPSQLILNNQNQALDLLLALLSKSTALKMLILQKHGLFLHVKDNLHISPAVFLIHQEFDLIDCHLEVLFLPALMFLIALLIVLLIVKVLLIQIRLLLLVNLINQCLLPVAPLAIVLR